MRNTRLKNIQNVRVEEDVMSEIAKERIGLRLQKLDVKISICYY